MGKVFKFGDNISTDHIAPGRLFHLRSDLKEFSKHVLEDADPEFASKMKEDVEEISQQKGNVKLLTINPSQIAEDTNPEDSLAYPIMLSLNVGD